MIYTYTDITPRVALKWYVFTFSVNTFFAVFFWSLSITYPFVHHYVFSQCQGFSILNFSAFAQMLFKNAPPRLRLFTIFIFSSAGSVAGKMLAPILLGISPLNHHDAVFLFVLNMMIVAIIIGFLYYWEGIAITNSRIQEERKKQLDIEREIAQTQLKLIQTRIDPGFLFNTLNRILTLLDSDPETAKSMQIGLIRYLRLSLSKFRNETHALRQETVMIRAYLDLLTTGRRHKMGYSIDLPEDLNIMPIPTMLVHSLVETMASMAKDEACGGADFISVSGERTDDGLRIEVKSTGPGAVMNNAFLAGFENVRSRLYRLFGDNSSFLIKNDADGNLRAIMAFGSGKAGEATG